MSAKKILVVSLAVFSAFSAVTGAPQAMDQSQQSTDGNSVESWSLDTNSPDLQTLAKKSQAPKAQVTRQFQEQFQFSKRFPMPPRPDESELCEGGVCDSHEVDEEDSRFSSSFFILIITFFFLFGGGGLEGIFQFILPIILIAVLEGGKGYLATAAQQMLA